MRVVRLHVYEDGVFALVRGESLYMVQITRGCVTCSCPAFAYGHRPCKHIKAVLEMVKPINQELYEEARGWVYGGEGKAEGE